MGHAKTSAQNHLRAQSHALLDVSEARDMLTTVEDSLETIVDVLADMKLLVTAAGEITEGPDAERGEGRRAGLWGWIGRMHRRAGRDGSVRYSARERRLSELSEEIDDIVQDSTYAGIRLFSEAHASTTFFVNVASGERIEVSIEPLSAAILTVTADDIHVTDTVTAATAHDRIARAIADIQDRLEKAGTFRKQLDGPAEHRGTGRSIEAVEDAATAREQLEQATLYIAEEADEALLAQANATTNSTMHLFESMYGDDEGSLARIYSLDHDRENAPVTHLRRIMLGQSA